METSLRERIPLQKRKIAKKSIATELGTVVALGFVSIFIVLFLLAGREDLPTFLRSHALTIVFAWIGIVLALLCWIPFYQYLYFVTYFYDTEGDNLVIRKGVFAKRETVIPFSKMTDIYVDQDLLDVLFRLYDVHISTPTEQSGLRAHIDGVDRAGSTELRRLILERVNAASG